MYAIRSYYDEADRNLVVTVNMMTELVTDDELELVALEGFEQARGEHHEQAPVLGLEAGRSYNFV